MDDGDVQRKGGRSSRYRTLSSLSSVAELGADFASLTCGGPASNQQLQGDASPSNNNISHPLTLRLHAQALDHALPINSSLHHDARDSDLPTSSHSHLSSFDHWLIASAQKSSERGQRKHGVRAQRAHKDAGFLLPQVKGHRETALAAYIRSMPQVRRQLRRNPNTLFVAALVSAQLPFYEEMKHMDMDRIVGSTKRGRRDWKCSLTFKPPSEQRVWPVTQLFLARSTRVRGRTIKRHVAVKGGYDFIAPALETVPHSGIWVSVPTLPVEEAVASELRLSAAELAAHQYRRSHDGIGVGHGHSDSSSWRIDPLPPSGVVSLLDLDATLGIAGAAIKAVMNPVMKDLGGAVMGQADHTAKQAAGGGTDTNTPGQVMDLTLDPLKEEIDAGVTEGLSANLQASLQASMTDYLGQYFYEEIVHDSVPPLEKAFTEVVEKDVKDAIVADVPKAIRKVVPVVLTNRLGRALMHSVPPSLTQVLKIAHSPTLQYFCHRCYHGDAIKDYSLFKTPSFDPGSYRGKNYCELCHSSAERLYYHNYHATHYADYYSDYYIPYFAQSLVEMERTRTEPDTAA